MSEVNLCKEAIKKYNSGLYVEALKTLESELGPEQSDSEILLLAGECAALSGDIDRAEALFVQNVNNSPENHLACYNLGVFYSHEGREAEACSMYKAAYELEPSYINAAEGYGGVLRKMGRYSEAEAVARTILKHRPNDISSYKELGAILMVSGQGDEAVKMYRKGLAKNPCDTSVYSQLLFAMNYSSKYTQEDIYNVSREYGEVACKVKNGDVVHSKMDTTVTPRKIRIGYVSGDFRRHSVAYFIEPILFHHDREKFEVYCYSYTLKEDLVTERICGIVDHWRNMVKVSDDCTRAQIIADDEIDILIDLAGHSSEALRLFVYKPSKIHATYLGYPNTTGLDCVDYRFTDSYADPENQDQFYTEKLVRLPSGFLSFAPPEDVPCEAAPPCVEKGYITFGSFNNFSKVNEECIEIWCKILQRVENSKLYLKSKLFTQEGFKEGVYAAFESRGIGEGRLMLVGQIPSLYGHLEAYANVDIGLDTFPYNGTTTTCEAIWMGVPVVSLYGEDHRSRVGLSILSQIGLSSFAAPTARDYIKQAIKLASDYEQLTALRGSLRGVLAASSVCDAVTTTREIEDAYKSWTSL